MVLFVGEAKAVTRAPVYVFETKSPRDSVSVERQGDLTVFVVKSHSGMGDATIRLASGEWDGKIALRFTKTDGEGLPHLEGFGFSTDRLQTVGGFYGEGTRKSLHFYFAETMKQGALPLPDGEIYLTFESRRSGLEITFPSGLLTGSRTLGFGWIDAFRR